jgi:hypothetical protein
MPPRFSRIICRLIFFSSARRSLRVGVSGIDILAYHQGFFFGLFFVAQYLIVATARLGTRDWWVAMLVAVLGGIFGNALLQGAAYPHYETAMLGVSSLALASWLAGLRRLFACCLAWLPLIREDGGLYVAAVCLFCVMEEYGEERRVSSRTWGLAMAAAAGIVATAAAFFVKAAFFPGSTRSRRISPGITGTT